MSDLENPPLKPVKKPRNAVAKAESYASEREQFRKKFDNRVRNKALKAIEVLDKIMVNGRAEMARVAAARAIIDKAVPQETSVSVDVGMTYADTLRQLAAKMNAPAPLIIDAFETTPRIEPPAK